MLQQFVNHVSQQHLLPLGQEVLLAVSGGIDSVVLADLMHSAGYPFAVAHCNFHLRPGDCDRDEQFVRRLADHYGCACHVAQFDTLHYAHAHGYGTEEAARRLRYDWFGQLRRQHGYAAILTAHHRDDAIETLFLNLLRGTGLAGLHGILPRQGHLVRPLLPFSRQQIEEYARQRGLSHVEDVTNASLDYRRNRIRHQLIPLLTQIEPNACANIAATINNLRQTEQLLDALLEHFRPLDGNVVESGKGKVETSPTVAPSAVTFQLSTLNFQLPYALLKPYGFNYATVQQILQPHQSGRQFLSATHRAVIHGNQLILEEIEKAKPETEDVEIKIETLPAAAPDAIVGSRFMVHDSPVPSDGGAAFFDADTVVQPLSLRHWQHGDRFQPLGMGGRSQLVSDYFSDHHYTPAQKAAQLLLTDATGAILWIVGRRTDHPHRVTPGTHTLLRVEVQQ